ncbi:rp2, partial [Symbiodinium sp. CCMP2592]
MQRTAFDVNSIAALLRQTEANLAALNKPRQEPARYLGEPLASAARDPLVGAFREVAEPAPVVLQRGALGSGLELESQVVQLRSCLETLERRLEEELRSFLAISDKRLQAREEHLRGVGETMQASADAALEQLSRRVDSRLRELDRASGPSGLDEVWESLKRLQADCQDLDGKVRRATPIEEFAERLKELERAHQLRLEDRIAVQERRLAESRVQLQGQTDAALQKINRRCEELERLVLEGQGEKGDVAERAFQRLPEAAPFRELQEELRASSYDKEMQRTRLASLEAKLSKMTALESKVDFMEAQMTQQLEEQAQQFRSIGDLQHKLTQKLTNTEAAFQRSDAQSGVLSTQLQSQFQEERDRTAASVETLQLRLIQRLDEVEARFTRTTSRAEKDAVDHLTTLAKQISDSMADSQRQAERRLQSAEARCETAAEKHCGQVDRWLKELRSEVESTSKATELDMQRLDRQLQETASRNAFQEQRLADLELQQSRLEAVEAKFGKISELQVDQRLREQKTYMETMRAQSDRRYGDLDALILSVEEQVRNFDTARTSDGLEHRLRLDALEGHTSDMQAAITRQGALLDAVRNTLEGLEPMRATVISLESMLAATDEQFRSRGKEWLDSLQHSQSLHDAAGLRMNDFATQLQVLHQQAESQKMTAHTLAAKNDTMQKHLSSLEDVMRTLQERMASGLELESSPRAAMTEVQELMAVSESRLMQRTKSEVETLRLQLADLRALLNDGLDLRTAAAADLERRMLAAEKSATLLRSELNTTRMQAEETANREARLTGEVRAFTEKLSICQADVKEADAKVAGQLAEVARLQQSVLICQQQQRASQQLTQVSQLSAGSTTTVEPLSPEHRYTGQNAVLLRRIQDRLQRVEDSRDQFQLHLEERIRQLENTSNAAEMRSSSSATLMVSAVRSSVGPQLDEVKTRLDRHEETLRSLQLQISGRAIHQPTRVEPVTTRAQAESPESPSRERFDARLSRLEDLFDQLPTTQSVESSGLELSSLPASTAPPNSTMMLTLNWVDEHSESASSENIRSALREVPVNLVRVDTLPEGRGALGAQGRGTVCWLASTDTPAAETALRRQLTDPGSALRRLLPGLVAESSAVVPAPLAALAVGHARQLSARVNNLEDAQRQLADNLTSVERQVLSMEGRLAGSLGLTAPLQRRGDSRGAGGQSESSPLNLSSIGPPAHGRRDPVGSGRSPSDRIDADEDDASVDFDSAFNETAEASRRKEEQRHAAEQVAQVERERRRAEEEFERKRQEQADAERRRADAARKEREEAEEKRREEMRRLEEEAAKRQAEQAKRAREQAAEDARLQEEAEAARRLAEEEAEARRRKEAEEAEASRVREEEARKKRQAEEEARQRQEAEAEAKRRREEEEAKQRREAEAEAKKRREEEEARQRREAEAKRLEEEKEAAKRLAAEEQRLREEEEERKKKEEAARAGVTQPKPSSTPTSSQATPTSAKSAKGTPKFSFPTDRTRRTRVTGLPLTARARKTSKEEEVKKVFDDITKTGAATFEDLLGFLCDHLGFGLAEARAFFEQYGEGRESLTLQDLKKGYASLNPFMICDRKSAIVIRKPGSLSSAQLVDLHVEVCDDSEVYICDVTSQVFVDECKRCTILIGPCESSVFVRECEDCVFWIANQQLRTRDCKRCTFHLYSKTEPVIETSEDMAFAPWSASYPMAQEHFARFKFEPARNLWNAIFDFSGKRDRCNWRILGLEEISHLTVELEDVPPAAPSNPSPPVTYEMLCAEPLESGESCGQSIGSIPQTRPDLPKKPPGDLKEVFNLPVTDGGSDSPALERLTKRGKPQSSTETSAAASAIAPPAGGAQKDSLQTSHEAPKAKAKASLGASSMFALAGEALMEAPKATTAAKVSPKANSMFAMAGEALMEDIEEVGTVVQGGMTVEDEDSSEAETPRPMLPKAAAAAKTAASAPKAPPTATDAKQVRSMFGESDEDDDEPTLPKP